MSGLGNVLRAVGRAIDRAGLSMQGSLGYFERLVPQTTKIPFKKTAPATSNAGFIAPNSSIVGDVTVSESASVWFNSSVRGDAGGASGNGKVTIGEGSAVGDRATVSHSSIGKGVTIGPNAQVLGAQIGDDVHIGANVFIGNGSTIGARIIIEDGAVVPEGTTVASGHVYAGNPMESVRAVTDADIDVVKQLAEEHQELARAYQFEVDKSFGDLLDEAIAKEEEERLQSDHWHDHNYTRIHSRRGNVFNRRTVAE